MEVRPSIFGIDAQEAQHLVARLTPRERQVAEYVALGMPRKRIGKLLHLALKTIDALVARIKEKLQTSTHGVARIWFAALIEER